MVTVNAAPFPVVVIFRPAGFVVSDPATQLRLEFDQYCRASIVVVLVNRSKDGKLDLGDNGLTDVGGTNGWVRVQWASSARSAISPPPDSAMTRTEGNGSVAASIISCIR